ncbi:MAG TPA: prolyl oligopeptidase family serine peptidase [Verrucomicrobiae bacterium]|jgi:prolyl oligopeptidase|nr:prolyl oligopeptidase family serine peptidase [Verrucomicrobiae bacterium]
MSGGFRLLFPVHSFALFSSLSFLLIVAATVYAADNSKSSTSPPAAPPRAAIEPYEEDFHGTKIIDNYHWLEDANSPETQKWVHQENAYTRAILDPLSGRDAIHKRLTELLSIGIVTPPQIAGHYYFYTRREGMQNQPVLYVRERGESGGPDGVPKKDQGPERVLIDANMLAADGTIALDWFEPSYNGKYVAYGTSAGGSEMSTLHIIETKTGTILPDTIERTRAASVAWLHDNSGFYYTRYPQPGDVPSGEEMYNRHVFFHLLGSPVDTDDKIFGEGRDPEDWPSVSLSNDGNWLLINVSEGWTKSELYLMDLKKNTPPTSLTSGKNFLYGADIYNGKVYITTDEDAPRYRVFVTDAGNYDREAWKEIIPQSDAVLQGVAVYGGKLFAQYEHNATSQLKLFDLDGKKDRDIALPGIGSVFATTGKWNSNELFFGFQSFTVPPCIYRVPLKPALTTTIINGTPQSFPVHGETTLWSKVSAPSIDPAAYEVAQEWFNSKDGTRVPMFVVHKKGLLKNGHNPTLLTGYGGFNVSLTPTFSRTAYLWMEHGGVFAVANLRGGAEFGEDWHRAGMLDKKQNVFDDMIAAAEHLISEKYTDKNHLAIQGGSNGGLLMGAMITQRPDLFRAVICQVPLLDMLHYQNFQIAKLWIPEYGSADNAEQFKWLYAYSPYHHVKAGVEYPAVLFMTADTDTRVDPMHAKKMTAEMQAEAKNGESKIRPILLRIESKAGHGAGKPVTKQIEEFTDIYSFLFWQLGMKE